MTRHAPPDAAFDITTIHIGGNYSQSGTGTLGIVVSPSSASQLTVGGNARLGGSVELVFAPGPYTAKTYTILTATGTVTGSFNSVTTLLGDPGLPVTTAQDDHDVNLLLAGGTPASGG